VLLPGIEPSFQGRSDSSVVAVLPELSWFFIAERKKRKENKEKQRERKGMKTSEGNGSDQGSRKQSDHSRDDT
jgi:hypothetical protein